MWKKYKFGMSLFSPLNISFTFQRFLFLTTLINLYSVCLCSSLLFIGRQFIKVVVCCKIFVFSLEIIVIIIFFQRKPNLPFKQTRYICWVGNRDFLLPLESIVKGKTKMFPVPNFLRFHKGDLF